MKQTWLLSNPNELEIKHSTATEKATNGTEVSAVVIKDEKEFGIFEFSLKVLLLLKANEQMVTLDEMTQTFFSRWGTGAFITTQTSLVCDNLYN